MRAKRWIILLATGAIVALMMARCERSVVSGSDEYHRLYGIINDGVTINRVQMYTTPNYLPGPWLTFPSGQYVQVNGHERLPSQIKKLRPTNIWTYVTLAGPGLDRQDHMRLSIVAIENGHLAWADANDRQRLGKRVELADPPMWGLRREAQQMHDSRSHHYHAIDESERFADGHPVRMGCHTVFSDRTQRYEDTQCAGTVYIDETLAITFIFNGRLLPEWRALSRQAHSVGVQILD